MHGCSTPHRSLPLSADAALVFALVGTALPFAHTAEDETERWLRAMRLQGRVGSALQALGVGESPLITEADPELHAPRGSESLDEVTGRATQVARARQAEAIDTEDLLAGVMDVYGALFERSLYLRGTSGAELLERLGGTDSDAEDPR
jgi:hypothetical protein